MKFLVAVFLAIFAVSLVRGGEDECTEERAEACIDSLLDAILNDNTEEEVCRELRTSVDCLRDAVDDCLGDERDAEVDEGLEELEKLLRENCEKEEKSGDIDEDEDAEIAKCFEENEDYIFECVTEGTTQALAILIEKGDTDENTMKCAMYGMMAGCFVERTRDKCGEKAATMADEELSDLPEEISEACQAAGGIETHAFSLLEDKRKK